MQYMPDIKARYESKLCNSRFGRYDNGTEPGPVVLSPVCRNRAEKGFLRVNSLIPISSLVEAIAPTYISHTLTLGFAAFPRDVAKVSRFCASGSSLRIELPAGSLGRSHPRFSLVSLIEVITDGKSMSYSRSLVNGHVYVDSSF
ncbi:hypothetical protein B296_00009563 [Ensete ventricosum]|uniref:Uncharacterized protein n=1 Tax=Ensete ventricosum TaxID=4639 RepID=A0A427ASI3_ENSVE|nr:hypothetical protein B296_00009563 [Ensete ventricosum]